MNHVYLFVIGSYGRLLVWDSEYKTLCCLILWISYYVTDAAYYVNGVQNCPFSNVSTGYLSGVRSKGCWGKYCIVLVFV